MQIMKGKAAQSAMESALLITFMTFVVIVFLALGTDKFLDVKKNKDKEPIHEVAEVIDTEIKLGASAQEGYSRVFELPYSIVGHNYTIELQNNSAVYISYDNYLDNYTAFVIIGQNINGTIQPGLNLITKANGTIFITPFCIDQDRDRYNNISCGGNDCNDTNSSINPGAFDICGNSIDEDCSGADSVCGALTCEVTPTDCTLSGKTDIMHMSAYVGHAELPTQNNYGLKVCCKRADSGTLDTICSGAPEAVLAKLSSQTNAHAEKSTLSNYPENVCMSAHEPPPSSKKILCGYASNCAAAGYMACLFTISSDTNAMVSDCSISPFATAVCCSLT